MRTCPIPAVFLALVSSIGCDSLPKRGNDAATVSIGQPTVYMRERSLVERFEDLEWLRLQRSPEKENEYEQGFQGSSRTTTAEFTGFALKLAIGEALQEDEPAGADSGTGSGSGSEAGSPTAPGTTSPPPQDGADQAGELYTKRALETLGTIPDAELGEALEMLHAASPTVSPRDKLVNRIAFRDTVAEEIRKRSLDDVHDLEGMALYEIQFDLSLVGGEDAGQSYAVMLEIAPACKPQLDEPTAKRVIEAMKAACIAEIEEATARYAQGSLTTQNSAFVEEAVLRGALAARHVDLMDVRAKMEALEHGQAVPWSRVWRERATLEASLRSRVETIGEGPPTVVPTEERWRTWSVDPIAPHAFRNAVLASSDEDLARAHSLILGFQEACDSSLRALIGRQQVLRDAEAARPKPPPTEEEIRQLQLALEDENEPWKAMALRPPVSSEPTAAERTSADEKEFRDLLRRLEELGAPEADRLGSLLRGSTPDVLRFSKHALGFVIARAFERDSGGVLRIDPAVHPGSLDARTLLPLLLKGQEGDLARWKLPETSAARVVSVAPAEVAEQVTTSAQSDIRRAFSAAVDGLFRGTITSAQAAFDRASQELRRYELIGRNSLLIGFVGGDGSKCSASNSFGWIMGPRLETTTGGRAKLRYRQVSGHYPVTATLIAPATLVGLVLRYRVFRINDAGEWLESRAVPHPSERTRTAPFPLEQTLAPRQSNTITLTLPVDPETIAQGILARNRWSVSRPAILAARAARPGESLRDDERPPQWRMQAGEKKAAITVLGSNLWRNPQVYVGGQRASRVQILSDLGGLWAEFDEVRAPAGQDGKPVPVDLLVSTSRGSDRILGGVEILPARAESKPPEPKLAPPVQVVVPKVTNGAKDDSLATVDLRFELTPPLPKAWCELRLRLQQESAAALLVDAPVDPKLLFLDPMIPGGLELRGLALEKGAAWDPSEVLECVLQMRESPVADLRDLHPRPAKVVLVRDPIACTAAGKLTGKQEDAKWLLASETDVTLTQDKKLDPAHLGLLLPSLKVGEFASAQASIGGLPLTPIQLKAKEGSAGEHWLARFPTGAVLGTKELAASAEVVIQVGRAKLRACVLLEGKK